MRGNSPSEADNHQAPRPRRSVRPSFLFEPEHPLRTIFFAWPLVSLPTVALAALVSALFPAVPTPQFPGDPVLVFVLVVLFAPVAETLVMAAAMEAMARAVPIGWAIALNTVGWAIAHSLKAPTWGLTIWWPFLIFSLLYASWRRRSIPAAMAIVAAVHALNNLIPGLILLRSA